MLKACCPNEVEVRRCCVLISWFMTTGWQRSRLKFFWHIFVFTIICWGYFESPGRFEFSVWQRHWQWKTFTLILWLDIICDNLRLSDSLFLFQILPSIDFGIFCDHLPLIRFVSMRTFFYFCNCLSNQYSAMYNTTFEPFYAWFRARIWRSNILFHVL